MDTLHRLAAALAAAALAFTSTPAWADHEFDLDCSDFPTQREAQEHMNAHPGDPDFFDADFDGIACECNPEVPGGPIPIDCTEYPDYDPFP
ncbi:hypothetical protein ACIBH1_43745 [Nonomuraea sp. NPDC050663]|uniref:hypothetical protein n=1 Tax=Nonomuraea sp. NPDC050663 TaxID=3364370 RepID=UPI0037A1FE74